ncbi:MAG TPA: NAD(P)-dependent oxidoreductase [Candidatus Lumbricidophila sp.]|nr:NAD(P)-dependent oxidoreductase [Candidatus Lumbricidophila sp.]
MTSPIPLTIALTGATSGVGGQIRPLLAEQGHRVILVNRRAVDSVGANEEARVAQLSDIPSLIEAFAGADVIVHLAGNSVETNWESILDVNIDGTRNVLEAARLGGVNRLLLASSNHAVGMHTHAEVRGIVEPTPAPDTYYGVSKVAMEALGSLYGSRYGMLAVSARIGSLLPKPTTERGLSTWLSAADFVRLIEATGTTTATGGHVVWAVSKNTKTAFDLTAGHAIGYYPQDDAQAYAAEMGLGVGPADDELIGGAFTADDYPVGVGKQ